MNNIQKAFKTKGLYQPHRGMVMGAGTSQSDSVPIHASEGEAVLPAKTVSAVGGPAAVHGLIKQTTGTAPKTGLRAGGHYADGSVPDESLVDGIQRRNENIVNAVSDPVGTIQGIGKQLTDPNAWGTWDDVRSGKSVPSLMDSPAMGFGVGSIASKGAALRLGAKGLLKFGKGLFNRVAAPAVDEVPTGAVNYDLPPSARNFQSRVRPDVVQDVPVGGAKGIDVTERQLVPPQMDGLARAGDQSAARAANAGTPIEAQPSLLQKARDLVAANPKKSGLLAGSAIATAATNLAGDQSVPPVRTPAAGSVGSPNTPMSGTIGGPSIQNSTVDVNSKEVPPLGGGGFVNNSTGRSVNFAPGSGLRSAPTGYRVIRDQDANPNLYEHWTPPGTSPDPLTTRDGIVSAMRNDVNAGHYNNMAGYKAGLRSLNEQEGHDVTRRGQDTSLLAQVLANRAQMGMHWQQHLDEMGLRRDAQQIGINQANREQTNKDREFGASRKDALLTQRESELKDMYPDGKGGVDMAGYNNARAQAAASTGPNNANIGNASEAEWNQMKYDINRKNAPSSASTLREAITNVFHPQPAATTSDNMQNVGEDTDIIGRPQYVYKSGRKVLQGEIDGNTGLIFKNPVDPYKFGMNQEQLKKNASGPR